MLLLHWVCARCVLLFLHAQTWGFMNVFFLLSSFSSLQITGECVAYVQLSFVAVAHHFVYCIFGRSTAKLQWHNENERDREKASKEAEEKRKDVVRKNLNMCIDERSNDKTNPTNSCCRRRWRHIIPDPASDYYQFYNGIKRLNSL